MMDWSAAAAEWKYFRYEVRTHWRGLTNEQLEAIGGQRGELEQQLRASFGLTAEQAEQQIAWFEVSNEFLRPTSSR